MLVCKKGIMLPIMIILVNIQCIEQKVEFNADNQIHSWVTMWNSYDLSLVDTLFLTDNRLTYLSSEMEGVIRGIKNVREHHRGFGFVEGGKDQDNKLWVENVHVQQFGTTAVVMGTWFFQRASDDSDHIQRGPFTFVYVQAMNDYRIAHANFANYCEASS